MWYAGLWASKIHNVLFWAQSRIWPLSHCVFAPVNVLVRVFSNSFCILFSLPVTACLLFTVSLCALQLYMELRILGWFVHQCVHIFPFATCTALASHVLAESSSVSRSPIPVYLYCLELVLVPGIRCITLCSSYRARSVASSYFVLCPPISVFLILLSSLLWVLSSFFLPIEWSSRLRLAHLGQTVLVSLCVGSVILVFPASVVSSGKHHEMCLIFPLACTLRVHSLCLLPICLRNDLVFMMIKFYSHRSLWLWFGPIQMNHVIRYVCHDIWSRKLGRCIAR